MSEKHHRIALVVGWGLIAAGVGGVLFDINSRFYFPTWPLKSPWYAGGLVAFLINGPLGGYVVFW